MTLIYMHEFAGATIAGREDGLAQAAESYFRKVPEARSPRSSCQGWFQWWPLTLACREGCLLLVSSHDLPSVSLGPKVLFL